MHGVHPGRTRNASRLQTAAWRISMSVCCGCPPSVTAGNVYLVPGPTNFVCMTAPSAFATCHISPSSILRASELFPASGMLWPVLSSATRHFEILPHWHPGSSRQSSFLAPANGLHGREGSLVGTDATSRGCVEIREEWRCRKWLTLASLMGKIPTRCPTDPTVHCLSGWTAVPFCRSPSVPRPRAEDHLSMAN